MVRTLWLLSHAPVRPVPQARSTARWMSGHGMVSMLSKRVFEKGYIGFMLNLMTRLP